MTVQTWVEELVPSQARRYDLRWRFINQQGSVRGRAAVRLAPPDSLRFDYRAPFGRSGAAVIVADSVLWSEPEKEIRGLIRIASLFWAALGIPRPPPPGARLYGSESIDWRSWRYVRNADTVSYVVTRNSPLRLQAEMRHRGRVLGTAEVLYGDATRLPTEAMMEFPPSASQFFFTVENVEALASLDPAVWKRP